MRPNLDDPAERAAYRQEVRRMMRVPRVLGFLLIAIGTGIVIYAQSIGSTGPLKPIGFGVMGTGWLNLLAMLYYQNRYHRARMADDDQESF
jgi:hypothetical protein